MPMQPVHESSVDPDRLVKLMGASLDPVDIECPNLDTLLQRIDDAKVVLLGESTHGTKEFYELRAKITLKLLEEKGVDIICLEADWPDVERINDYIHGRRADWEGFRRFPEWMWRNESFAAFVEELKSHNQSEGHQPVSIYGLDVYSLASSMAAVLDFFEKRDPELARKARAAQECLHPWQFDPSEYGLAVWSGLVKTCEKEVLEILKGIHEKSLENSGASDRDLLSTLQNARVIKNAEEYYRIMCKGSVQAWNLRDSHMFETLLILLQHHGADAKAVIWEHNSHIGNAAATQMGTIGEHNVGQLCKARFKDRAYAIGFLTNTGTVAAASQWDGPVEIKSLRPVRKDSYEYLMHKAGHKAGVSEFFLPLHEQNPEMRTALLEPRLERAVGVLYLPQSERSSHYFKASLPEQFDEVCWIEQTRAVDPLPHVPETEEADTYPFGL